MGSIHCAIFNITMNVNGWRHTVPNCIFYVTYHNKWPRNGSFTLPDTDLDSKPDGYIVLCRTCSHCTDSDSNPTSYFCVGQESESEFVPEFIYGNENESLHAPKPHHWCGLFTLPDTDLYLDRGTDICPKMGTVVTGDPSPNWNPNLSLCNMDMFCIVQCSHWVRNRNLSQCLNLCLAM